MFANEFKTSLRWKSPHLYIPCMHHRSTKMVTGHHASASNLLLFGMCTYMHNIERCLLLHNCFYTSCATGHRCNVKGCGTTLVLDGNQKNPYSYVQQKELDM